MLNLGTKRKVVLVLAVIALISVIVVHHTLNHPRTRTSSNIWKTLRFLSKESDLSNYHRDEIKVIKINYESKNENTIVPRRVDESGLNGQDKHIIGSQEHTTQIKENATSFDNKANEESKEGELITTVSPSADIKYSDFVPDEKEIDTNHNLPQIQENVIEEETPNLCPEKSLHLVGVLKVDQSVPDMLAVEKQLAEKYGAWVEPGGKWRPTECTSRSKVAIIIPYRKRYEQLSIFVKHMHPMLKRQQLDYRIFVIEQYGNTPFNRAMLFNIGYAEAIKLYDFGCFIFHDVDLIPEDDRNDYGCPKNPRHMSVAVDKFNYRLPYHTIFGGVGAFNREQFELINGFSNAFWGWGGEDDDLYQRIVAKNLKLIRPSMNVGRYKMIRIFHKSAAADPERMDKLRNSKIRMAKDGINTLKYNRKSFVEHPLYTLITVDINKSMV